MTLKLLGYLKKLFGSFILQFKSGTPQKKDLIAYSSLSPIDTADQNAEYEKALQWALKNRRTKDIKNIALTGPYGSGKSSILKTFQKNYDQGDLKFLNISLATFKEEEKKTDNDKEEGKKTGNDTGTDELLRLIELSILQQIFYHEEDKNIPDSRFKKIRSYSNRELFFIAVSIIVFLASIVNLKSPEVISKLLRIDLTDFAVGLTHFLSLGIALVCVGFVIFKSIRVFNGIKISKFSIGDGEIEMNDTLSKSILNHHLDEILYFFEVTDYNVVIIEDLDRFRQTEIFTKLREMNLLLNSSKKTAHKNICFIYAVRDEMFVDKDRTKFFDFIIPVIPVINSSNSSQKLLEKQNVNSYKFSEDLIEDVSLFIDDMRLLHNVLNEFYLYYHKLEKNIDQDKLLAMLIYKNVFPNDFACLSNNEGMLYKCINSKSAFISKHEKEIEQVISAMKEEIRVLENLQITSLKELRALYLLRYMPSFDYFECFIIDYSTKNIEEMLEEENFEYLVQNKARYRSRNNSNGQNILLKFDRVEMTVDANQNYSERKNNIVDFVDGKTEQLKQKIEARQKEMLTIRNYKLKDALTKGNLALPGESGKQKDLLNLLLRNGYIDEDYNEYISIFYPGSITKSDHQFLLSVKSQQQLKFDYALNKIDKLIAKINILEFEKNFALNYDLVDYVMDNDKYDFVRNKIFYVLQNESEISINFIEGYVEYRASQSNFIYYLCKSWKRIWKYVQSESVFSEDKKMKYFKSILQYADLDDLDIIAAESDLVEMILSQKDFLNMISGRKRNQEIIELFDLKFRLVDLSSSPKELIDFIYENENYEINHFMVKEFLSYKKALNVISFDTQNYYAIKTSGCDKLITYIDSNLEKYIKNIYLTIDQNTSENEETYVELLNSQMPLEIKKKVIDKVQTKINTLTQIEQNEVDAYLLERSKVKPSWENLAGYFASIQAEVVPEPITQFLQDLNNAESLAASTLPLAYENFTEALIKDNNINEASYDLLLNSVTIQYGLIDISNISAEKVLSLIKHGTLSASKDNYNLLKTSFNGLHILILERHKTNFLSHLDLFDLDAEDINKILVSDKFENEEKNVVTDTIEAKLLTSHPGSISCIGRLIIENKAFRVSEGIIHLILNSDKLSVSQKIEIFNGKHTMISNEFTTEFLSVLGEPFSEILINGKRPLLENTHANKIFADILSSKNIISSYEEDKRGIRIATFRKSQDQGE